MSETYSQLNLFPESAPTIPEATYDTILAPEISSAERSGYDPNAGLIARLEESGVGGGLNAAAKGDLTSDIHSVLDSDGVTVPNDVSGIVENRLFELPGKNGNNNWYNESPTSPEVQRGMTRVQIDAQQGINKKGAEAARVALDQSRPTTGL